MFSILLTLLLGVISSIIANYICKWLDSKKH